ncbi:hypothetical protein FB451DRAFT_1397032 [Mycena latifolia]|nr:hypothetical protein FB451DRAFT_1397032 [Mycena latifolia]
MVPPHSAQRVQINWVKNIRWTHSLVTYLCENPIFRIKLFSDSTAEAKKEGRTKQVAKDGKAVRCGVLAKYIFAEDPNERARYQNDPAKYATSTETRLRRLKKEYQKLLERLGATGAGLDPSQIQEGSKLSSLIEEIRQEWPWWDDLHAFWRELPNYNPVGVQSSEPGTDHASAAADIFDARAAGSDTEPETLVDGDVDYGDEFEDDRSEASKARDGQEDTGGDDKSHSSSSDVDDKAFPESIPVPSPRPQTPASAPAKIPKGKGKAKAPAAVSGRDLGLAKANAGKSSTTAKKKPQNAIDRMNDIRETESRRLAEKRKLHFRPPPWPTHRDK